MAMALDVWQALIYSLTKDKDDYYKMNFITGYREVFNHKEKS